MEFKGDDLKWNRKFLIRYIKFAAVKKHKLVAFNVHRSHITIADYWISIDLVDWVFIIVQGSGYEYIPWFHILAWKGKALLTKVVKYNFGWLGARVYKIM